jgi:hypothetical protein
MEYFVWYDESMQKSAAEKIGEAAAAYHVRFARAPHLVLVNSLDQTQVGGMVIRTEQTIQRNNFWLGVWVYPHRQGLVDALTATRVAVNAVSHRSRGQHTKKGNPMSDQVLSVYAAVNWGARLIGVVLAHRDATGVLFVDDVPVSDIYVSGHFSVLHGVDGRSHIVLTSFLRLVPTAPLGWGWGVATPGRTDSTAHSHAWRRGVGFVLAKI